MGRIPSAVAASYDRCNHMSQFINKLADMVRIPEPMLSDVRLNELLRSVEAIARIECQNRNIRLTLEAAPPETVIRVDGIQFEQVLLNIIKNSYEAIGNGGEDQDQDLFRTGRDHRRRQRARHSGRDRAQTVQSVFHDKTRRSGHRG